MTRRGGAGGVRHGGRVWRTVCTLGLWCALAAGTAEESHAAEPAPVMVRSAPGRFEVAAMDASVAHAVVALADETWRTLAAPLGLPAAFSTPVFVRVLEATSPTALAGSFAANVEPGGVVSVWIREAAGGGLPGRRVVRRALVRGLLLRLDVAAHGARAHTSVPDWLEIGASGWCETRADPAQLDALKYESGFFAPPSLVEVLVWRADAAESRALAIGAVWLWTLLLEETSRGEAWRTLLDRMLAGGDAAAALAEALPGRFASAIERELWWQTGWHQLRRARGLPGLGAEESRHAVAALARFVFTPEEKDVVVPLREVVAQAHNVIVVAELQRRQAELARVTAALHPFYRNAGLSLAEAFATATGESPAAREIEQRDAACAQFERDWRDAVELEAATKAALDRAEAAGR